MNRRRTVVLILTVAITIAITLAGVALASRDTQPKHKGTQPRSSSGVASKGKERPDASTATDPDNLQQGDQTTPDAGEQRDSESSGDNESSLDSEPAQPGDPAVGHEDTAGQDLNHECTGDCAE